MFLLSHKIDNGGIAQAIIYGREFGEVSKGPAGSSMYIYLDLNATFFFTF